MDFVQDQQVNEFWINLGCNILFIKGCLSYVSSKYYNRYTKYNVGLKKLEECFSSLRSRLDDVVCRYYPRHINNIKYGDHETPIVDIFYPRTINIMDQKVHEDLENGNLNQKQIFQLIKDTLDDIDPELDKHNIRNHNHDIKNLYSKLYNKVNHKINHL